MRKRRSLLMMLILAVLVLSTTSFGTPRRPRARHQNAPFSLQPQLSYGELQGVQLPNKNPLQKLGVKVDGAKDPTLISDDRAYTHFLIATMGNGEKESDRREALLKRVGLAQGDRQAFGAAVIELGNQLPTLMAQRQAALLRESPGEYENVREQERALINSARSRVDAAGPPAARAALDSYVQQFVKPKIVVYGGPMHVGH